MLEGEIVSRGNVTVLRTDITTDAGATQWLVQDDDTGKYYIVSGVSVMFSGWEVLVFPGDEEGKVTDWGEVAGGRGISMEAGLQDLKERLAEGEAEPW